MKKIKLLVITSALFLASAIFSSYSFNTIYTPNGTAVRVYSSSNDFSYYEKKELESYFKKTYPNTQLLRQSTKKYNCHSFAWYSTDADNPFWLDTPGDDAFWKDGSYIEISKNNATKWSKVSYASDDHSAIYWQNDNFISKWGQGPLVYHAYDYCPYNSSRLRYFELNE